MRACVYFIAHRRAAATVAVQVRHTEGEVLAARGDLTRKQGTMTQMHPPVEPVESEAEAVDALLALIGGFEVTQALRAAAELGIADLLAGGPCSAAALATATGTRANRLERLLRYLTAFGVITEVSPGEFAATPRSDLLRRDHPRSLRATARFFAEGWFQAPYARLAEAIRTGEDPFELTHGVKVFSYLAAHPEDAALFNAALATLRAQRDAAVAAAYDFSDLHTVVDVAGGYGNLLVAVLRDRSDLHGVLFDRPPVVEGAGNVLTRGGVAERCRLVGGDMFVAVPPGGDAYLLANVIHDWGDTESLTILRNCRRVLDGHGRLLLVEAVVEPGRLPPAVAGLDLRMMAMVGEARQRTVAELSALLEQSGFRLARTLPTASDFSVLEAVPN